MPQVTVVIPTHNRCQLLSAALRSALAQRGLEIEVVVVDDGSTDGTAEALASLNDQRVRVMRHRSPRGVAAARNAGAAAAQGEWVAFLDDDDLWSPDKLRRQMFAAQEIGAPWSYAGAVEIDEQGRLLGGTPPPRPDVLIEALKRCNLLPAGSSNVLVQRALLSEVGGFDQRLRHVADWDLWQRLARRAAPAAVLEPLVAYRQHAGQATLDTTGMAEEARLLNSWHGSDPVVIDRWAAWSYLRAGRRWPALRLYLRAVLAGDHRSGLRALVVLLHRRPTNLRRGARRSAHRDHPYLLVAQEWLDALQGHTSQAAHEIDRAVQASRGGEAPIA
jgi:glycosyltransferase involved in cell wall biosynthesis